MVSILVLLIGVRIPGHMHQVVMAVNTFFHISVSGKQNIPVGHHGAALVRNIYDISMALPALLVLKRRIGFFFFQGMVVLGHILGEMNVDVLDSVGGLSKRS